MNDLDFDLDAYTKAVLAAGTETAVVELGPTLTKGFFARLEFDCTGGCAFDSPACSEGSGGWHGVGARRLTWYARATGRGAVACDMYTPVYLPKTLERMEANLQRYHPVRDYTPLGSVDMHLDPARSPAEANWMTRITGPCEVSGSDDGCWCDGTTLQADLAARLLVDGGSEAIWSWLAEAWLPDLLAIETTENGEA